jgi:hypothetical protein
VIQLTATSARGQQRPLVTEDPETIGAGRILIEAGLDWGHEQEFPASGLTGNLLRGPVVGVSFGLSSITELQIDGSFYDRLAVDTRHPAPLSDMLDFTGDTTSSIGDFVVATKIRILGEGASRPAFGVRLATKLPNASNESGLGLDTMDFFATLLVGKTIQSVRVVGNVGLGILGDPTRGDAQNDVLAYGVSVARAFTDRAELVFELNGRMDTAEGDPPPGTETRGTLRVGGRYTMGAGRIDAALLIGTTSRDADIGVTMGYTHVFDVFRVP